MITKIREAKRVVKESVGLTPYQNAIEVAEGEGWSTQGEGDRLFIRQYSPAGEDFGTDVYIEKDSNSREVIAGFDDAYNDFDEDDFRAMKDEAISSGASEPVVLSFLAKDKDRGLSYLDAEAIIDFLCSDLEIVAYGCDFDDVHKVMYMVVDWNSVVVMPEHVCNSTWSVVS